MSECVALAERLVQLGESLFVEGAIIGPDRVEGTTNFGYGDDRVVAVALAIEIGGDLATAAVRLLSEGHAYSAAALLRQVIEVEYLLWLFAHDDSQPRRWLNADDDELRRIFRPVRIREQSDGHFDTDEYQYHCGWGGHPSPNARYLLSTHSVGQDVDWMWDELECHLTRLWETLRSTLERHGLRSA